MNSSVSSTLGIDDSAGAPGRLYVEVTNTGSAALEKLDVALIWRYEKPLGKITGVAGDWPKQGEAVTFTNEDSSAHPLLPGGRRRFYLPSTSVPRVKSIVESLSVERYEIQVQGADAIDLIDGERVSDFVEALDGPRLR